MKRLLYIFAFLFVTWSAMAHTLTKDAYVYFAKPSDWTYSYVYFFIGNNNWSSDPLAMNKITNTNLYYAKTSSWNGWGYDNWSVFNTSGTWAGSGGSLHDRKNYAQNSTWVGTTYLKAFNLIPLASTTATTGTSHTFLNKTHTIKTYVDGAESSAGGTIKATSYKLSSANATATTNGTTSIEAAYTATIKLTATVNDGYEFIGWYDGSTLLSSSATYSSYSAPNSAKTISAKFRKLAVAEPQIVSFSASASEIDLGQSVTFNVEVKNADEKDVVFKNGNTVITPPWTPAEGGEYTITANLGAKSESVVVKVYTKVYFDNTISNWTNVYAYCWNEGGSDNKAWPGIQLEKPAEGNIYTYRTIPYEKIIFNNNSGKQTDNLDFENGKTYSMPKPTVAGTASLCGKAWDVSIEDNMMDYSDGLFTKIFTNVQKGEHKFKVYDGGWLGYNNRFSSEYSSTCTNDNEDNIKFTLDTTATVIISYNNSTDKIELKVVYNNFEVGEKIYFSSDQGASPYAAYLFGESGETWVKLSQEYANIYSATIPNGNWGGVIFCSMTSETLNRANINSKTKYLEYEGKNWYKWTSKSEWRNFENLIYAEQKLYFKPDSNWESANARFAAYYKDVLGENKWADCVYDSVDHAYHVVAPTVGEGVNCVVWTNIKFVRMKPNSENNWENDWNTTPDLVYDGANDFFIIKLTGKDWDTADPNNWISFSHPFEGAIFFEPNASLKATAKKRFSIYLWNGFDENCWAKMQPMETHPDIYCVVIPEGYWTGANICSMNPDNETDGWDKDKMLKQTDNLTYHSDKLLYKAPDTWDNNVPADEYWTEFESNIEDKNLVGDVASGVYFQVFKYNKTISGEDVNKWHWISLPYNVKIREIEGGVFGTDFIIQEYDTEARAKWENNIAAENKSAWRMMEAGETLLAGKGYILAVNNEKSSYTLTFVSETDLNVVADEFDGNNINYSFNVAESANWHLIGTGLYGAANSFGGVDYVAVPQGDDYQYYNLSTEGLANINAYGAFFVQHTGDYSFSKVQPAQNAAPRRARDEEVVEQYYVNIVGMADTSHTAIFLAEDGSDDYVVGKDFLHLGASGASLQLYTLQGESTLSFNYLKREDRTVLVGGYVAQSGKYTISLDAEGDASSVLLYDMETGLVADLLNENYEFEAEKGILDGRFSVIISYAKGDGPATEVENDMTMGVVVVNCDGIALFEGLLVGESVVVYDVMGRCVTQFVAENDKADVMLISGVYMLYHNGETVKFVVNR